MRKIFLVFVICFCVIAVKAQIGYQVSLLNSATGEPRANITVRALVEITDAKGGVVYSGSQNATSNDFGVLALTVGDKRLFDKLDTGKLPLYISVSVDGILIGKSQILNVPVACVAEKIKSSFVKEDIEGTWIAIEPYSRKKVCNFDNQGTYVLDCYEKEELYDQYKGVFEIDGNNLYLYSIDGGMSMLRWYDIAIYSSSLKFDKK